MSTTEELQKQIDDLKLENKILKKSTKKPQQTKEKELTFKVSEKKALSVYGLNRFPVTLYKEQWILLFEQRDKILNFIEENNTELVSKSS